MVKPVSFLKQQSERAGLTHKTSVRQDKKMLEGWTSPKRTICFYDPIVGTKKHFAVAKMQFKIRRHVYGRVYGSPHPETRSKADK